MADGLKGSAGPLGGQTVYTLSCGSKGWAFPTHSTPIADVEIELDAKSVVDLLNISSASIADYAPLVDDCKILMNRIPRWKLKHCFREANACADQLARMALHLQQPFVLLDTPLVEVSSLLLYVLTGLGCNRCCTNTDPWAM